MNYYPKKKGLLWALLLVLTFNIKSQPRTVGLTQYQEKGHQKGYYLLSPLIDQDNNSYLLDDCGRVVKTWQGNGMPGAACILGHDGSLIRTVAIDNPFMAAGCGGAIEKFNWSGKRIWRWELSDSNESLHHDITEMPNGNILAIVWVRKTAAEAEAMGRKFPLGKTDILFERIIEIQPKDTSDAEIVWEWSLWDHVIQNSDPTKPSFGTPSQKPELLDLNYYDAADKGRDWLHLNGIDYNPSLNQIAITSRSLGEFYIIDHSTTSIEATGHTGGRWGKGGDFLYRWGNPAAYGRGTPSVKRLFVPHHAHWIKNGLPHAGNFLVFNNGVGRPGGAYSTVDMVVPPLDSINRYKQEATNPYMPLLAITKYKASNPASFFSPVVCGSYMLKNGNLLTTHGLKGQAFETDSSGNILWSYTSPASTSGLLSQGEEPAVNTVFRYEFYHTDFSGFTGKDLTPGKELELNPYSPRLCENINNHTNRTTVNNTIISPNPAGDFTWVTAESVNNGKIYNSAGHLAGSFTGNRIDLSKLKPGLFILTFEADGKTRRERLIKHE